MTIFGLCFSNNAHGLASYHDPLLVAVSYLVAVVASFTALEMSERLRGSQGASRWFWRGAAAVVLGGGTWSMHFVGMLAFKIPLQQAYDPAITALSGLLAIASVAIGLQAFEKAITWRRLAIAGLLVGLGIALMHYVGMSGLRISGRLYYRPGLFVLSVVIAAVAAISALGLAHRLRLSWQRGAAALVMALAICGTHYVAMAATVVVAGPSHLEIAAGDLEADVMAGAVVLATGLLFCLCLVCAFVDRRLEQRAVAEAQRLRALNSALAERTEALSLALAAVDQAQRAEAASRARSTLLANMSHELRTPLNAVLGFAAVLRMNRKREPLTPRQDKALACIVDNGRYLLAQIEAMLELIRLDKDLPGRVAEPLDLAAVLELVCAGFAAQAESAAVRIVRDRPGENTARVLADGESLRQVFEALVSNAIKYNRCGGEVRLMIRRSGDQVEIAVSDTGSGIAARNLGDLFEPFNRLGREGGAVLGVGLGLAIAKRRLEAMDGVLHVESVENQGSTFTVTLPAAAGEANAQAA